MGTETMAQVLNFVHSLLQTGPPQSQPTPVPAPAPASLPPSSAPAPAQAIQAAILDPGTPTDPGLDLQLQQQSQQQQSSSSASVGAPRGVTRAAEPHQDPNAITKQLKIADVADPPPPCTQGTQLALGGDVKQ